MHIANIVFYLTKQKLNHLYNFNNDYELILVMFQQNGGSINKLK